jgi:hypothetical protein
MDMDMDMANSKTAHTLPCIWLQVMAIFLLGLIAIPDHLPVLLVVTFAV